MFWSLIGKAVAVYLVARLICFTCTFLRCYVFPLFGLGIDLKSYGDWAVVTGASDGIGKSYSKQLAKKGLNLVLISRSKDKLDVVAKELVEAYNVKTKIVVFDFDSVDGYEKIEKELKDLKIAILVNNVGVCTDFSDLFLSETSQFYQKMINVNVLSAVKMTHMVLKGMLQRKKGILIHVSSASAYNPFPLLAVYCSTKAFIDFFARALQVEYRDQGIISQALLPALVATKMNRRVPSSTVPEPDAYTRQAVQTIGIASRTSGYWTHDIQAVIGECLPSKLREYLILKFMK